MTSDEIATIKSALTEMQAREEERYAGLLREFDTLKASNARTHDRIDEVKTEVAEMRVQVDALNQRVVAVETWEGESDELIKLLREVRNQFKFATKIGKAVIALLPILTVINLLLGWMR